MLKPVQADVEWEQLLKLNLKAQILDVTASSDGDLIFALTPGHILVFSVADQNITNRIPVDKIYDRIAYAQNDTLTLTSHDPASLKILQIDRIYEIDLSNRPFKGAADAKITIAVFDDYQWPYCAQLERLIQQVLDKHPKDVKYVIKHFPLSSHRYAFKAAMAALAANNQGKFWEFHHELFKNFRALNEDKIKSIAEDLGLDMDQFNNDLESPQNRAVILQDLNNGKKIKVRGTPTVFMNGKKVENRQLANLSKMIEKELGKSK